VITVQERMTMVDVATRTEFEQGAQGGAATADLEALAKRLREVQPEPSAPERLRLAAAFAHVAFAAPDRVAQTYDAIARGWLGDGPEVAPIAASGAAPIAIDPSLWPEFWALLDDAARGMDAGEITPRTAALGAHFGQALRDRSAAAAMVYAGVREAAAAGYPPRMTLEALAACPAGSLGNEFYRLIVDNGFDLEVLDREALGLSTLVPPLDYLNARILQCHDLWHIVGGYRTTALHEVAISAFQLAQFGHGYSAMFLAVTAASLAMRDAASHRLIMDVMMTAWRHGRQTPPMIGIPWETVWGRTTEEVRAEFGVTPYVSPYPADLFEALKAA
jgi:ubiquinone biosynthesis protein Coq4